MIGEIAISFHQTATWTEKGKKATGGSSLVNVTTDTLCGIMTGAITDWKCNVVWGDNHAEFLTSSTGLSTRYADTTNTGDGLFTDSNGNPGEGRDNALFNYVSANY